MNGINFSHLQGGVSALWSSAPTLRFPKAITPRQLVINLIAATVITAFVALLKYKDRVITQLTGLITSSILGPFANPPSSTPGGAHATEEAETLGADPDTLPPSAATHKPDTPPLVLSAPQELLMTQLNAIKARLQVSPEDMLRSSDNMRLVKVLSEMDGNCMFHSIASYLMLERLTTPTDSKEVSPSEAPIEAFICEGVIPTHIGIRAHVADYMHDEVAQNEALYQEVKRTIRELNQAEQVRFSQEKEGLKVAAQFAECSEEKASAEKRLEELSFPEEIGQENFAAYIERLRELSFFGGGAELHVLAKFYDITIRVYVENRDGPARYEFFYEVSPSIENPGDEPGGASGGSPAREAKPVCHLLYSPEGPHYDFLMPVEPHETEA